jgi:hypothetical protein
MAERSDDLLRSRQEAALLLRLDPQNLSPSDALRCDLIATLRLSIDSAQADALEGRAADLGRLIVATESLVKLLPSESPKPESHEADPRQQMWEIYRTMRARGELAGPKYSLDAALKRIDELEAQLAAGGLTPALPDAADRQVDTSGHLKTAITPRDVVPASEWRGETYAGTRSGPDDPKPPVTIEGKANPPAARASRPPDWDSTPSGRAWRTWVDAGSPGGGFDRWSNRNIP